MKKALLLIATAMFIFAGCQKEQPEQKSKSNNVIHISVEQMAPATKVAADDIDADQLAFHWEEGDEVIFFDQMEFFTFIMSLGQAAPPEKGTIFTCTNPLTGEFVKKDGEDLDPSTAYSLVYPANFSANFSQGGYEELYRGNQIPKEHPIFDPDVLGDVTEFVLNTHLPVIHFKLLGTEKIGRIEYIHDAVATRLVCEEGVQLSETEPVDFYMDLISYGSGFELKFFDTTGGQIGDNFLTDYLISETAMIDFNEPIIIPYTAN